jgi:hypothetical protein
MNDALDNIIEAKDKQKRIDDLHLFLPIHTPLATEQDSEDKKVKSKYGNGFLGNLRAIEAKKKRRKK